MTDRQLLEKLAIVADGLRVCLNDVVAELHIGAAVIALDSMNQDMDEILDEIQDRSDAKAKEIRRQSDPEPNQGE